MVTGNGGMAINMGGMMAPHLAGMGGDSEGIMAQQAQMLKRLNQINQQFTKKVPPMERMFKKLGLDVSLKGMLKQSQIFTGTLGAIFQILGAFIDVALAPMIPLIVPFIRKMTSMIPMFRKIGEFIKNMLVGLFKMFKKVIGWIPGMKGFQGVIAGLSTIVSVLLLKGLVGMLGRGAGRLGLKGLGALGRRTPGVRRFMAPMEGATANSAQKFLNHQAKMADGIGRMSRKSWWKGITLKGIGGLGLAASFGFGPKGGGDVDPPKGSTPGDTPTPPKNPPNTPPDTSGSGNFPNPTPTGGGGGKTGGANTSFDEMWEGITHNKDVVIDATASSGANVTVVGGTIFIDALGNAHTSKASMIDANMTMRNTAMTRNRLQNTGGHGDWAEFEKASSIEFDAAEARKATINAALEVYLNKVPVGMAGIGYTAGPHGSFIHSGGGNGGGTSTGRPGWQTGNGGNGGGHGDYDLNDPADYAAKGQQLTSGTKAGIMKTLSYFGKVLGITDVVFDTWQNRRVLDEAYRSMSAEGRPVTPGTWLENETVFAATIVKDIVLGLTGTVGAAVATTGVGTLPGAAVWGISQIFDDVGQMWANQVWNSNNKAYGMPQWGTDEQGNLIPLEGMTAEIGLLNSTLAEIYTAGGVIPDWVVEKAPWLKGYQEWSRGQQFKLEEGMTTTGLGNNKVTDLLNTYGENLFSLQNLTMGGTLINMGELGWKAMFGSGGGSGDDNTISDLLGVSSEAKGATEDNTSEIALLNENLINLNNNLNPNNGADMQTRWVFA